MPGDGEASRGGCRGGVPSDLGTKGVDLGQLRGDFWSDLGTDGVDFLRRKSVL